MAALRGPARIIADTIVGAAAAPGSDRRFNRFVIGFMATGFAALLAIVVSAGFVMALNQRHAGWVAHTYEVERQLNTIRLSLARIEAAAWAGPATAKIGFDRAADTDALGAAIKRVGLLTADNPLQQARMPLLRATAGQLDSSLAGGSAAGAATATSIERLAHAMRGEEDHLLAIRTEDQRASAAGFDGVLGAAGILLIVVGTSAMFAIRRYTRDLAASRDALGALNDNLEGLVRGRTVDLQRANDEIQRFAYIVSHDLRSPLVNVMGFTAELETATGSLARLVDRIEAEAPALVDKDAAAAARGDLPEAIRFIRSSTQKMDRLINAILRLSREGRRTLAPERVDMAALAQGVADSLQHRTAEAGARIRIDPALPAIVGDRLAIEQILSNLVENAVKYLQPGRAGIITIEGRRTGPRVLIEVIDNGRGIDPRDHERVFDLFRRSGTQDQPGEGIGLAHVRALAYRLGGTISLDSTLGAGATFRLNLPAEFVAEHRTDQGATG